jgi:AcrR family transcriptional regulator
VTSATPVIDWTKTSAEGRVMAAALRLFTQRGFQAVGIREIAQEAGISTATLYHYMKTKEDLLDALMRDRLHRLIDAAQRSIEDLDAPAAELGAVTRIHVTSHALYPSNVVDDELHSLSARSRKGVVALRDRYEEIWDEILAQGNTRRGPFSIPEPRFARLALMGMCNGVNRWFSTRGPATVETVADRFADLALAMVQASANGKPLRIKDLGLPPASDYVAIVREVYTGVAEA